MKLYLQALAGILLFALPSLADARPKIVCPSDQGLVLGDVALVEVSGSRRPPACRLDGAVVTPTWHRSPRRQRWVAEIPLPFVGTHRLEVGRRRRHSVEFDNATASSLAVGDLVADRFLDHRPTRDLDWQWGPAVFLYGLHRLSTVSPSRPRYLNALEDYHAHHAQRGLPTIDYPDRCASALSAVALLRVDGITAGRPNAVQVADYLRSETRNQLGALNHLGTRSLMFRLANIGSLLFGWIPSPFGIVASVVAWPESIWVDSLVMYALFCVQWGRETGDLNLYEFGLAQPGIFARAMQDPTTGLFHHGYDVRRSQPLGAFWLRGNGWVVTSIVEMLEDTPANHPRRPELLAIYQDLVRGLMDRQLPNGLWPTLLDHDRTYDEASGSALAAYGIARGVNRGYLPPANMDRARRAFRALTSRLERRPVGYSVTGTSTATNAFPAWTYPLIPRRDDVDYGVGAYLLLASELRAEQWR